MSSDPATGRPVHYLPWLVLTTVFWGGSFVFNKIGFREVPPLPFLFLRFSVATILMGLLCARRLTSLDLTILKKGVFVGLALAATNLTFVLGVSGTTVSRAGFLNNLFVLIIPVISYLLWRDRFDRLTLGGIVLAVAGLGELGRGSAEVFNSGDIISAVCSFFIALHIIAVSRVLRDEDVFLVTFVQFATVAAIGGIAAALLSHGVDRMGMVSLGAIGYCAVFPTVISFTIQNTFQRYTTPTQAGLIYTLDPVWSMLGGILILNERLSVREWNGCILILAAVAGPLLIRFVGERRRRKFFFDRFKS